MLSQETKVIGLSLAAMGLAGLLFLAVETTGLLSDWTQLIGFVLIAGFGIVAPQLYLARTDHSVPATSRYGILLVVLLVVGAGLSNGARTAELIGIWGLVGVAVLMIAGSQVRAGYLATSDT